MAADGVSGSVRPGARGRATGPAPTHRVQWTETATGLLGAISDKRIQRAIHTRAKSLDRDPAQQGKPLLGEFMGLRSIRAVGQRYRVIYQVEPKQVVILLVGLRKDGDKRDVYALAQKLMKQGLLG